MSRSAHAVGAGPSPPPPRLEDRPAYRDEWVRQHPALSLLYHHDVITHLVWCAVACRYLTGGVDGEVKLWKSEPAHARSASAPLLNGPTTGGDPARPWLLPERHIITTGGPVSGLCVTDREAATSEVAVIASTDGTLTLCRTNTGEIVRTLRAARGESIESFRIPAVRTRSTSAIDAERDELVRSRGTRRSTGAQRSYAADAVSRRLAPMSDLAIVRRPVYTIHAYRDEVRDVFAGPSNGFFHGLRAVAPTYAHLAPQEETVADVLAAFGVPSPDNLATTSAAATTAGATAAAAASAAISVTSRQWHASAVAIAVAPDARRSTHPPSTSSGVAGAGGGGGGGGPLQDLYLFLGFPEGLLQVYVLPRRWFQLHLHGETRLDPPCLRFPVLSTSAHTAAVLRIEVLAAKDLVVSVSEDGTTQLRRLSALHTPLRQLGAAVAPTSPLAPTVATAASVALSPLSTHVQTYAREGLNQCHTRFVTCCCVDVAHQLLITGSADHTLCWWSLMAGSPATPTRVLSLRDAASNVAETAATTTAGSGVAAAAATPASGPPTAHGGYPIDVSFFYRRRARHGSAADTARPRSPPRDGAGTAFLLVLDTEHVVRIFDAMTGKLCLVQAGESTKALATANTTTVATAAAAASTGGRGGSAALPANGDARVRHNVRLIRYDDVNGADRLLLGGLSLVPWYLTTTTESNAVDGHKEPILFSAWSKALRCVVTADAHHVLLWRYIAPPREAELCSPTKDGSRGVSPPPRVAPCAVEVVRAWKVPLGIRAMALCERASPAIAGTTDTAATPTLLVATREQPLLVQYDCLADNPFQASAAADEAERHGQLREPLPLCQLSLRMESDPASVGLPSVTALAGIVTSANGDGGVANGVAFHSPTDVAALSSTAYVCAVCQGADQGSGGGDRGGQSSQQLAHSRSRVLMYTLRDAAAGVAVADSSAAERIFPSREISPSQRERRGVEMAESKGASSGSSRSSSSRGNAEEVVSVLPVPARRLLALGGRRVLYVTTLFGSTSSATPCASLPAVTPTIEAPTTSRRGRKSVAAALSASWPTSRCTIAVFPGAVMAEDELDGVSSRHGQADSIVGARSNGGDSDGAAVTSSTAALEGYLSRLVHLESNTTMRGHSDEAMKPAATSVAAAAASPCLILSGSNAGVVQLWDAQAGKELWRCTVSLTQEPITALAAQRYAERWAIAVGDQTGVVTVLDLTNVVRAAQEPANAAARGSMHFQTEDARMVDRWQAHAETVSGVCFAEPQHEAEQATGVQLFTTGEDTSIVAWTLPLLPTNLFGSALTGQQLFRPQGTYPLHPGLTVLPWSTRDVYARLQERYVRRSLFARFPDLQSAFTSLYTQPDEAEAHAVSEAALLDRAWAVLVADAEALVAPPRSTGLVDAATVHAWCVSLTTSAVSAESQSAKESDAVAGADPTASRSTAIKRGNLDEASSLAPLVLAFADRCCGADPRRTCGKTARAATSHRQAATGPVSAVRASLRVAVQAVVRASTAQRPHRSSPTPSSVPQTPPPPPLLATTAADVSAVATPAAPATRPTVELFSAVATIAALSRPPAPASAATPTPLTAAATAPAAPATTSTTTALSSPPPPAAPPAVEGGHSPMPRDVPSAPAAPQPSSPSAATANNAMSARRVLFAEQTHPSSPGTTKGSAVSRITSAPSPNHGYRVAYGSTAPLVRGTLASPDPAFEPADDEYVASPSPSRGVSTAARESVASTAELPFSQGLDGDTASASVSDDDDDDGGGRKKGSGVGVTPSSARAAAVVERVHRGRRRRGHALQQLAAQASDEENAELFSEAKSAVKANRKLTRESISRYVMVKDSCRTLIDDAQPRRGGRVAPPSHNGASGRMKASKAAASTSTLQPAHPVVANTYLAPALARVKADPIKIKSSKADSRRGSAELSASTSSAVSATTPMSWYAMRQLKRDAAQESARLWNAARVMQTLMGWSGTAAESSDGAAAPSPSVRRAHETRAATTVMTAASEDTSPKLHLPFIMTAHTSSAWAQTGDEAGPDKRKAKSTHLQRSVVHPLLPELLSVPPTAAVDAAVQPGLPTRATLQAEMTAMQARMRQSVQQRAAQQRLHRGTAGAAAAATHRPGGSVAAAHTTVDGGASEQGDDDDIEDGAGEESRSALLTPELTAASPVPSNEQSATRLIHLSMSSVASGVAGTSLTSRHKLGLARQSQRRGLQSNDGTDARQMATVPLPNATTRRDLFAHRGVNFGN